MREAPAERFDMGAGEATTNTLVSLYLLLLTFFIALQALAGGKPVASEAVLDSVHGAFGHPPIAPAAVVPQPTRERQFQNDLEAFAQSEFGLSADTSGSAGGSTTIYFEPSFFFAPGSERVRADRTGAVRAVADFLGTANGGARHLQVVAPAAAELSGARAIALAGALLSNGAPDGSVVPGQSLDEGMALALRFRVANGADR